MTEGIDTGFSMKRVLTYGTYDLLHWGHIRLLKRAKALGDYLVVGVSTDEFNLQKPGKRPSYHSYDVRKAMLESVRYVDLVIPEMAWEQKLADIKRYEIDTVVMGSDWAGSEKFEYLRDHCELVYLPRTEGTSTSQIRRDLLFEAIGYMNEAEAEHSPAEPQKPLNEERAPQTAQLQQVPASTVHPLPRYSDGPRPRKFG